MAPTNASARGGATAGEPAAAPLLRAQNVHRILGTGDTANHILGLRLNVYLRGPAGSGKTELIGLDVDWQRQARQFLPSYTADALLQVYLGPDCVVQEVSAPLLEDETLAAPDAERVRAAAAELVGRIDAGFLARLVVEAAVPPHLLSRQSFSAAMARSTP